VNGIRNVTGEGVWKGGNLPKVCVLGNRGAKWTWHASWDCVRELTTTKNFGFYLSFYFRKRTLYLASAIVKVPVGHVTRLSEEHHEILISVCGCRIWSSRIHTQGARYCGGNMTSHGIVGRLYPGNEIL